MLVIHEKFMKECQITKRKLKQFSWKTTLSLKLKLLQVKISKKTSINKT